MHVDRAKLQQFLLEKFSAEELESLLAQHFAAVYYEMTVGMKKSQQINMLLDYCQKHDQFELLLRELQERRPHNFDPADYSATPEAIQVAQPEIAPQPRNPRQIFLSHASRDQPFARRLAHDLRRHGWQIWMAPDSIRPGEGWVQAINRGLQESGVFLLVLTGHAVNSRWVRSETDAAIQIEHQGQIRFVPLLVEAAVTPPLWQIYQWVSFRTGYEQGRQQLLFQLNPDSSQSAPQFSMPETLIDRSEVPRAAPAKRAKNSSLQTETSTFIHPITGNEMIYVPAGTFLFGDNKEKVHLDEFWIDKTPVTNAAYKRFLDANPEHRVPTGLNQRYTWNEQTRVYPQGMAAHPVVYVSWHDAQAYAAWSNAELPSEQQWEKAARGTDGRTYPWGDDWREDHANTKETGIGDTTPVRQFSPQGDSPYGCVDMSGNVWEWTSSREDGSDRRVLRGGSWGVGQNNARVAYRGSLNPVNRGNGGFRVVVVRRPPFQDR